MQYALIEAPVRRKVKTSSILSGASKLRGFRVSPTDITFGVLREGSTYKLKLKLKNIGVDSAHFKVRQPPPSTGIKIIYTPGAVSCALPIYSSTVPARIRPSFSKSLSIDILLSIKVIVPLNSLVL